MGKKNLDRVFGCHAAVEVAMVGISDEDVDKLHKESCYGMNRPNKRDLLKSRPNDRFGFNFFSHLSAAA